MDIPGNLASTIGTANEGVEVVLLGCAAGTVGAIDGAGAGWNDEVGIPACMCISAQHNQRIYIIYKVRLVQNHMHETIPGGPFKPTDANGATADWGNSDI